MVAKSETGFAYKFDKNKVSVIQDHVLFLLLGRPWHCAQDLFIFASSSLTLKCAVLVSYLTDHTVIHGETVYLVKLIYLLCFIYPCLSSIILTGILRHEIGPSPCYETSSDRDSFLLDFLKNTTLCNL